MGNRRNNKEDGENMGMYKYIKETFEKEYHERSMILRRRITEWRKQGTVARIERPTNLARARSLGYKAKQGIAVACGFGFMILMFIPKILEGLFKQ